MPMAYTLIFLNVRMNTLNTIVYETKTDLINVSKTISLLKYA